MGFAKLSISFMLIALFSIALITFAVNFANDNESEISLADTIKQVFSGIASNKDKKPKRLQKPPITKTNRKP